MTSSPTETTERHAAEAAEPEEATKSRDAETSAASGIRLRLARLGRLAAGKRARWVVVVVIVVAAAAGVTTWRLTADDLPDGAAFQIGDTTVTADEVERRIDALQALYGVEVPTSEDGQATFRGDAAKSMAVQIMLEEEADDRGIAIAEKEVSDTLQALIDQRYPDGGRDAFIASLGEMGATEDQVRDEISSQLLVSRLFDEVVGDVSVSDEELRAAFEERSDELATPVRRVIRNIVVADRNAALQVLAELRSGLTFEDAAASYSLDGATRDDGGLLGSVAATDLEKRYAQAAFGADAGELFGPVRTTYGWNVGRVDRVVESEPATFAGTRDALREMLLAEESLDAWRTWLGELIAGHDVQYADGYRPDDPGAVPDIDQTQIAEQSDADKK